MLSIFAVYAPGTFVIFVTNLLTCASAPVYTYTATRLSMIEARALAIDAAARMKFGLTIPHGRVPAFGLLSGV